MWKHLKSGLAAFAHGLLLAAALSMVAGGAFALNVDQNRIPVSRVGQAGQQPVYYRLTINYNDPNIGTAQRFGTLPANAYILAIDADVTTAFNAGSTNVVTLGVTTSANELVASSGSNASITAGSTGIYHLTAAAGLGLQVTGNSTWIGLTVPLYAKYAQTGTAATAGSVTFVIEYIKNDDM